MEKVITPELIVKIKNNIEFIKKTYPNPDADLCITTTYNNYCIIVNVDVSSSKVETLCALPAKSNNKKHKKLIKMLESHSLYAKEIDAYIHFGFKMSLFIFELYLLTGFYQQFVGDKKIFYYVKGKKQEED